MITFRQIAGMTREELIAEIDRTGSTTQLGLGFFREELFRRDVERQGRVLLWLTVVVTVLTAVNVALVYLSTR